MGLLPDKVCGHGKPLQASCHQCKGPERTPSKPKPVDARKRTSGTYTTGILGRTKKTSRTAKKR